LLHFAIWIVVASLFHKSVLLLFAYYPLYWYAETFRSTKAKFLFLFFVVGCIVFSGQIVSLMLPLFRGIVPRADAIAGYLLSEGERIPYKIVSFLLFASCLFWYKKNDIFEKNPDNGNFLMILAFLVPASQLLILVGGQFAFRLAYLATWWLIFLVPTIFSAYGNGKVKSFFANAVAVCWCLFFWWFNFIHAKQAGTQNYESSILGSIF
jgi:hypothetical protein